MIKDDLKYLLDFAKNNNLMDKPFVEVYDKWLLEHKNINKSYIIHLFNRDDADLNLVSNDNIHWYFKVDDAHKYILECMTVGYRSDNKDECNFIDPTGGQLLRVGNWIDNKHQIDKITRSKNKGYCIITNNINK